MDETRGTDRGGRIQGFGVKIGNRPLQKRKRWSADNFRTNPK
jgi:hypothetical protein